MKVANKYLSNTQWISHYYKDLCDKTLAQINEQQLQGTSKKSFSTLFLI